MTSKKSTERVGGGVAVAPQPLTGWPSWTDRFGLPDLWQMISGPEVRVEEFRENGTMVVRAELPGIDPDKDVAVTVKDGVLSIHAERTVESSHEDDRSFRSEFRYGSFDRMVRLPAGAKSDDVKASYHDGILEVRVPMGADASTGHKVPVARS